MNIISNFALLGGVLALAIATGCSTTDEETDPIPNPPEPQQVEVGSAATSVGGLIVSIYAEDSLDTRYTPLFIEVRDAASDGVLTSATISITPMMDMGMMQHSAPSEAPVSNTATDGKFPCAAVFTMPSDTGWTLKVDVYDPVGDRGGVAVVPLKVAQASPQRVLNISPLDGSDPLIVSFINPQEPKVGQNPFEVLVNRKASMMDFPPADNLSLTIDPQMPSMGHGSPNNVDPTDMGNGHYEGTVNFTMTGTWLISLDVFDGATALDTTAAFEVSF